MRVKAGQHDGLIAHQPRAPVDRMRIPTLGSEVGFDARHKKAARVVQAMEPFEVEIISVHDVEGTGLGQQQVKHMDVVSCAVADVQERGGVAAQVQERVQLDGRLGRVKRNPRKHRQAQVDSAGIQRVDRVFQIDPKRLPGIQTTGDPNERLGKLGTDTPIAHFVGIGQRAARNPALDVHVVQLARLCAQARFDVAQALAIGQLGKGHAEILLEAGKALELVLSTTASDATAKRRQRHMLRDLRKHQLASVHRCPRE